MIEQSEQHEGPWITVYKQVSELRDLMALRARRTAQQHFMQTPDWAGGITVGADGVAITERGQHKFFGAPQTVREAEKQLLLAPERVCFTALAAPDLKTEKDALLFGVRASCPQLLLSRRHDAPVHQRHEPITGCGGNGVRLSR